MRGFSDTVFPFRSGQAPSDRNEKSKPWNVPATHQKSQVTTNEARMKRNVTFFDAMLKWRRQASERAAHDALNYAGLEPSDPKKKRQKDQRPRPDSQQRRLAEQIVPWNYYIDIIEGLTSLKS